MLIAGRSGLGIESTEKESNSSSISECFLFLVELTCFSILVDAKLRPLPFLSIASLKAAFLNAPEPTNLLSFAAVAVEFLPDERQRLNSGMSSGSRSADQGNLTRQPLRKATGLTKV